MSHQNDLASNYDTLSAFTINDTIINFTETEQSLSTRDKTLFKSVTSFKSESDYGSNLRFSYLSNTGRKSKLRNYYAPKCICLISVYPFFLEFSKILKTIHKYSHSLKLKKPMEKIIENLVIEVPVPPRGLFSVEYQLFNEKYVLTQTKMNKLPFISIEFERIFINFRCEQILEIYKHILLETRIIFFSQDISALCPIILGFISLIYPFKYPFQFVTILPEENYIILESISPYIIGINVTYDVSFFSRHGIDISDITYLIVDIDNRNIELNSPNLNTISNTALRKKYMNEEFPDLPKHYRNKLFIRIKDYIEAIKSKQKEKQDRDTFIEHIRNLFFQFIVSIFQNYNKYLNFNYYTNNDIATPSINNLFKVDEFISSVECGDRPFYKKMILETQLFADFIYKRMIPKDSKEKLEILYFDENIIEKNNRKFMSKKSGTPFIKSNLYEIKNSYSVQKHRNFSDYEINYFKDPENRLNALKFGQEISIDGEDISITYPYFPTLMTDIFFKNSVKLYFIPPSLTEELDPINIEMVSISHLGNISCQQSEMENYIYLCWIQLWAMTFWYHDENEKKYRFQHMLSVLEKVQSHEVQYVLNFRWKPSTSFSKRSKSTAKTT